MAQEATRRSVLTATVLATTGLATSGLTLTGCKGIGALGTPPKPLPDVAVATRAIAGERALIARYTATIAALPSLARQLRPILAQHTEHLARLRSRLSDPHGAAQPTSAAATGASTASASTDSGAPTVPGTPAAALAALRTAENAASAALAGGLGPVSPSFAQLLASISASEATHALVLHSHGHPQ